MSNFPSLGTIGWYSLIALLVLIFLQETLPFFIFDFSAYISGEKKESVNGPRREQTSFKSLGYLSGKQEVPAESGILTYDEAEAENGLNLYVSSHAAKAYLMDMEGEVLHKWKLPWDQAFPEKEPNEIKTIFNEKLSEHYASHWRKVHLYPNGDLLAIFEGRGIIKIDSTSNLIWSRIIKAHHDVTVDSSGNIYVLTRELDQVKGDPVIDEHVTILKPDGDQKRKISILQALMNSQYYGLLNLDNLRGELLHTNSIQLLENIPAKASSIFQKGSVLLSLNIPSNIIVLDLSSERVTWASPSVGKGLHDTQLLTNGNLLFFNNHYPLQKDVVRSQVLEMNPELQKIEWEYKGTETKKFYSMCCGTNQRLSNGNTLITETQAGRALEITETGKIVWEFVAPHVTNGEKVAQLYELRRYPRDYISSWLNH